MPFLATSSGFDIRFSRWNCLLFIIIALPFSALMLLAGINIFVPVLDGTVLHWLVIERKPAVIYGAISILGSLVIAYGVLWSIGRLFGDNLAIRADGTGVETRSIIGRRSMAWSEIASVSRHKSTLILHARADTTSRPVPLWTFMTSVSVEDLQAELMRHRPDLFDDLHVDS